MPIILNPWAGGVGNGIKSVLQSNDSNWLWGCREKGSLEANRNLQKDHCATCLCCGTLRNTKLRFSCHFSMSEHFIHYFSVELNARHLRKGLGPTGEGWQEEKTPDLRRALHYKAVGGSSPALSWVHSTEPCQVLCPMSPHHILLYVWGLSSL